MSSIGDTNKNVLYCYVCVMYKQPIKGIARVYSAKLFRLCINKACATRYLEYINTKFEEYEIMYL